MNYASTLNIREVIKFYNLGDKTFETDFNFTPRGRRCQSFWKFLKYIKSGTLQKSIQLKRKKERNTKIKNLGRELVDLEIKLTESADVYLIYWYGI